MQLLKMIEIRNTLDRLNKCLDLSPQEYFPDIIRDVYKPEELIKFLDQEIETKTNDLYEIKKNWMEIQ